MRLFTKKSNDNSTTPLDNLATPILARYALLLREYQKLKVDYATCQTRIQNMSIELTILTENNKEYRLLLESSKASTDIDFIITENKMLAIANTNLQNQLTKCQEAAQHKE